jgi:hypothetical protein
LWPLSAFMKKSWIFDSLLSLSLSLILFLLFVLLSSSFALSYTPFCADVGGPMDFVFVLQIHTFCHHCPHLGRKLDF